VRVLGVLLLPLWLAAAAAGAQEAAPVPPEADPLDLPSLVGLTLPEALEHLGVPAEMFASRGEEGWQDDVVFYYPSHLYLFWYRNRVWQARLDERYSGSFLAAVVGPVGTEGGAKADREAAAKAGAAEADLDKTATTAEKAAAAVKALVMGRSRDQVLTVLGPPMREIDGSLVYHLEDRGYPVRLRLYFRDGRLVDAYCYRGDL
jgi:hypothetical protein